jgi:Zinc finger, C2H2 type
MARYKPGYGMGTDDMAAGSYISCKICGKDFRDRTDLIEHLRTEHEILELASYTANTMAAEQERDRTAGEFRRRFELLKRELAGHEAGR